jgi:hypothetical protein
MENGELTMDNARKTAFPIVHYPFLPSEVYQFDNIELSEKCETSFAMQSVINLMARGLHNRSFSSVFAEVYRTCELVKF